VQLPVLSARRRWLELALDYRCNLRCLGCHACSATGGALQPREAAAILRQGREHGIDRLWLGGGEPTLRPDLLSLVAEARRVGYREIALQTNGMRLSYPKYREALLLAGVTQIRFNVKSHKAVLHDRLSGGECHAFMLEALDGLAGAAVELVADVLLTRSAAGDLPEIVAFFAGRRVTAFVLWLLSAADAREASAEVANEVPRISSLSPVLLAARAQAARLGVTLQSLHTPPCTLPEPIRDIHLPARALSLLVVGPDARPFPLEDSPFEGGAYTASCEGCASRRACGGPRADYRAIHGDGEFAPIADPGFLPGGSAP
jgi:hypothetical protein